MSAALAWEVELRLDRPRAAGLSAAREHAVLGLLLHQDQDLWGGWIGGSAASHGSPSSRQPVLAGCQASALSVVCGRPPVVGVRP